MSDLNELIQRAEAALKKEESFRPWFVEADAKAVVDGDRYPLDDRSQLHMAIFFENTPALIRELVDALKEAETNLDNALMREQRTVEEMETWMDRAIKAGWKNE